MSLSKKVSEKLEQYGLKIYDNYKIENENEYVFYVDDMILFVNEDDETIGVSFQATTKPERSAKLILIVSEIKAKSIDIMESFIFNKNNEYVSGFEAYDLIEKAKKSKLIGEVEKQFLYKQLLQSDDFCFKC